VAAWRRRGTWPYAQTRARQTHVVLSYLSQSRVVNLRADEACAMYGYDSFLDVTETCANNKACRQSDPTTQPRILMEIGFRESLRLLKQQLHQALPKTRQRPRDSESPAAAAWPAPASSPRQLRCPLFEPNAC